MMSTCAAILATTAGWRYVLPSTMVPTRMRGTRAESALSVLHDSSMAPSRSRVLGMKWSVTQAMSHPVASRCRQKSSTPAQVWAPMLVKMPKRMSLLHSSAPCRGRGAGGPPYYRLPGPGRAARHRGRSFSSAPARGMLAASRRASRLSRSVEEEAMPTPLAGRAIVVGAGMGGLTAARALADHVDRVVILERDALPERPTDRVGIPQGKHVHALLAGGQRALSALFPGFERDLVEAGAVPLRVGLDVRTERPGYDPFPPRDLGWDAYAMSRAQVEFLVRRRVREVSNVEIRQRCRVQDLVARPDGTAVTGVRYLGPREATETLAADLVIDASGQGTLTLELLRSLGRG